MRSAGSRGSRGGRRKRSVLLALPLLLIVPGTLLALGGWSGESLGQDVSDRSEGGGVSPSPPEEQGLQPLLTGEPSDLFEEGNRRYQENDFAGALEAYLAIVEMGFHGPDLYYNLGNAFFKTGDLGRSILNYERAHRLRPGDADIEANLELARSLTVDEIDPLPRFWVLSVLSWWTNLLPRAGLVLVSLTAYLVGAGGLCLWILSRRSGRGRLGAWLSFGGALGLVFFGTTLLARDRILGAADWGVVLSEVVPVQSAPSDEADLTLFLVHQGTKVRIDQTSEYWLEVVLEDGKVGWVPADVLEII